MTIPNFGDIELGEPAAGRRPQAAWQEAVHERTGKGVGRAGPGRRRKASASSRSTPRADTDGLDFLGTYPGYAAVPARPLPDDVREPAVDHPPVRRFLHGRGVQRLLPAQSRRRAEGPFGRVRPGHPPRLRLRPPARRGRRRHGRRGHRLDLRHAPAVRRHPAGQDERVHDHERRRAAGDGAVRGGRRGAGRRAGAVGRDHPERHPQGVHGPQHLHLSAAAVDADHLGHLRLHVGEDAEVQLDLHFRLPHAGSRRDRRPGTGLHPGRRGRVPRAGIGGGLDVDASRPGCRSSGRSA